MKIRETEEHDYDDIMEREKKLKMAWQIKNLLVKQSQWSMTLLE
jgi:bifunctional ADP-heptose synthase (sugar kinase/adenylyltransferase)